MFSLTTLLAILQVEQLQNANTRYQTLPILGARQTYFLGCTVKQRKWKAETLVLLNSLPKQTYTTYTIWLESYAASTSLEVQLSNFNLQCLHLNTSVPRSSKTSFQHSSALINSFQSSKLCWKTVHQLSSAQLDIRKMWAATWKAANLLERPLTNEPELTFSLSALP